MSEPATFVEPRGMIRSIVAATAGRELLGAVGGASAQRAAEQSTAGSSPIKPGQIAYLALGEHGLTLFRAKRGAFKPKATDEELASAARSEIQSVEVERGRIAGVLNVAFADGSTWAFDVPKVHLAGAEEIASAFAS
jgi:hypothetical protein